MRMGVIGLGLIGGSMVLSLRQYGIVTSVVGCDAHEPHAHTARALGIVDDLCSIENIAERADVIVVAVPVDAALSIVPQVLEQIQPHHVVFDVGSTKQAVVAAVQAHHNRGRFVATHPMWGTEHSGPEAAVATGFAGRAAVVCNSTESDADSLKLVQRLYTALGMQLVYMQAAEHDWYAAYGSHIAHLASFALANTLLEKEQWEMPIATLAGAGLQSCVRLAASSPAMWIPIFQQNRENITEALHAYIMQLQYLQQCIENNNTEALHSSLRSANGIHAPLEHGRQHSIA